MLTGPSWAPKFIALLGTKFGDHKGKHLLALTDTKIGARLGKTMFALTGRRPAKSWPNARAYWYYIILSINNVYVCRCIHKRVYVCLKVVVCLHAFSFENTRRVKNGPRRIT